MRKILFIALMSVLSAWAQAQSVTLTWNADTDPSVIGYNVWWGQTSGGPYPNSQNVGNVTSATITGLSTGKYYFVCTAYNAAMVNSTDSNQISATIPNPPAPVTIPVPATLAQAPTGTLTVGTNTWSFGSTWYPNGYALLLNGVRVDNGLAAGVMLFNVNGVVWCVNMGLSWFQWNGSRFISMPTPTSI